MTDKERERDKELIAKLEAETSEQADEIERLKKENKKLRDGFQAIEAANLKHGYPDEDDP